MKLIDFDKHFQTYLEGWMRENAGKYKNMDELEAKMPDAYLRFLNKPAEWLDGETPGHYFARYEDAGELVDWLRAYDESGVDAPDLLLERIVQLEDKAVKPLMKLASDETACPCLRSTALNMLIELGTPEPLALCLDLVAKRAEDDEVADVAAEVLEALGARAVPGMLDRLENASDQALIPLIDLLCNFPGDERIYEVAVRAFLRLGEKRALLASCLGKLGDARAIEPLRRAMAFTDINYLDYLEIANAIEMLGGEAGERDREFAGDPYYESLKQM